MPIEKGPPVQIVSSVLELLGLILAAIALYHLGGLWVLALVGGTLLTVLGWALGRPAQTDL